MKLGGETWKWALVVILLAVFILVANQAYRAVNNPEDQFPPPDDYTKGDSFDIERNPGPGAGQPVDVPGTGSPAPSPAGTPETPANPATPESTEPVERPVVDWNELKSPSPAAPSAPAPAETPAPSPVPAPAPRAPTAPAGN